MKSCTFREFQARQGYPVRPSLNKIGGQKGKKESQKASKQTSTQLAQAYACNPQTAETESQGSPIAEASVGCTARAHKKEKREKEASSLRTELTFYRPKALGSIPSPERRKLSNHSHIIHPRTI